MANKQIDIYEVYTKEGGHYWLLPPDLTPIWDHRQYPVKTLMSDEEDDHGRR